MLKTPTLRNVALTAPFMHNGVFKTLEEVMGFYDDGGAASKKVALPNQTLSPQQLHPSKQEIMQIILFLQTLTDVP